MENTNSNDSGKSNRPAQKNKHEVSFSELVTVKLLGIVPEIENSPQGKNHQSSSDNKNDHADMNMLSFQAHRCQLETKSSCSSISCSRDGDILKGSSVVPLANTEGLVTPERMTHQRQAVLAILSYQHRLNQMSNTCSLKYSRESATSASTAKNTDPNINNGNIRNNKNNAIETLLSRASRKFSQRAKDIALEIARLNCLEVYPERKDLAQPPSRSALFAERRRADSKTRAEISSSFASFAWQSSGLPAMKLSIPIAISEFPTIKQKKKRCRRDDDIGGSSDERRTKNLFSKNATAATGAATTTTTTNVVSNSANSSWANNANPSRDHSTTNSADEEETSQIHYAENDAISGIKPEDGLVVLSSLEKSVLGPLKKRYRGNAAA
mmetsp:Transcript_17595/g.36705  ORF Transcript_17595/g.36705 Transcript_17595/m.36705 type:complete len:383 (+) Transcript_17595:315-1463(+)